MLILRSADPPASPSTPDNPDHMAIHALGVDLVGPLKRALGGYTHLLITVDKFTKWIEARSIFVIKFEQVVLFFLDIVHCFGVLNSIIMDNGT